MQNIMNSSQLTPYETVEYSNELNRFKRFKINSSQLQAQDWLQNKLQNMLITATKNLVGASNLPKQSVQSLADDSLRQDYPGSPDVPSMPYFLTPPTIRPEPKPYWNTNDTDLEENSDENNDESDDVMVEDSDSDDGQSGQLDDEEKVHMRTSPSKILK
jgi:hypothetical protein